MRNLLVFAILIATISFTSCKKDKDTDYTNPADLSGTTWKYVDNEGVEIEYALLKFTSATTVEGWTKESDEADQKDWTGTYSITNSTISITWNDGSFTGIIDGETITATIEDLVLIFTKQ